MAFLISNLSIHYFYFEWSILNCSLVTVLIKNVNILFHIIKKCKYFISFNKLVLYEKYCYPLQSL